MEAVMVASTYQIERNKPMPDKLHAFLQQQLLFGIKPSFQGEAYTFGIKLVSLNIKRDGK